MSSENQKFNQPVHGDNALNKDTPTKPYYSPGKCPYAPMCQSVEDAMEHLDSGGTVRIEVQPTPATDIDESFEAVVRFVVDEIGSAGNDMWNRGAADWWSKRIINAHHKDLEIAYEQGRIRERYIKEEDTNE